MLAALMASSFLVLSVWSSSARRRASVHGEDALGLEDIADVAGVVVEGLRQLVEAARARQIDLDDLDDAAPARAHHHDAVGEQHRLRNTVRDVQRGLARLHPQFLDCLLYTSPSPRDS